MENFESKVATSERFRIRDKIAELVYFIEQVSREQTGLTSIKLNEEQNEEFVTCAKKVLHNDELWSRIPESGSKQVRTLSATDTKEYTRSSLKEELQGLVDSLETQ